MELKITKENYKGYLEFYLLADNERKKRVARLTCFLFMSFILSIIASLFSTPICIGFFIFSLTSFIVNAKKMVNKYEISDKVKKLISEQYSYVNTEINYYDLCKILFEEKIIKVEDHEEIICEKEYLNYVECEEIKKEIFNERLYETTITEPVISDKELEKAKTKIKKLTYPVSYINKR